MFLPYIPSSLAMITQGHFSGVVELLSRVGSGLLFHSLRLDERQILQDALKLLDHAGTEALAPW